VLSAAIDKQIATDAFKEGTQTQDDNQHQADDSWACSIQEADVAEGIQSEIALGGDTSVVSPAPQGMDP
jgi:hypothetical protein